MANVVPLGSNFPRRVNQYVPAMQYSADVNWNGLTRISFGAPALAVAAGIKDDLDIAAAGSTTTTLLTNNQLDAPWGRSLTYVASGAATSTVTVDGWDYLGQPMTETKTLNGATPVLGTKAFKTIRLITWGATAGTTIDIGFAIKLGLPYKCVKVDHETADQVLAAAGTLTAAVLTDPQTATTGDPRGLYTATTTLDGSKVITAACHFMNDVNSSNHGGLYGIAHYVA